MSDHLGSTTGTVNASGALTSSPKYTAFGETRGATTPITNYRYTGQREEAAIGLYFYKARFYDAALGRFVQPDTIVPNPASVKSWDRYAYVYNNPICYTDPSGYIACEDSYYGCTGAADKSKINGSLGYWRWVISSRFGITLKKGVDFTERKITQEGNEMSIHYVGREWDTKNAMKTAFDLEKISSKGFSGTRGAVFNLFYHPSGLGHYGGSTHNSNINFFTSTTIPSQNLYHEFGHLVDNMHGDVYTRSLANNPYYSARGEYLWGGEGIGNINVGLVLKANHVNDPDWPGNSIKAIQHADSSSIEQWADIFANYIAGNIADPRLIDYITGGGFNRR